MDEGTESKIGRLGEILRVIVVEPIGPPDGDDHLWKQRNGDEEE